MAEGNDKENLKMMSAYAVATVSLAAVTLVGIAVVTQFKASALIDNSTADDFIAGLAIFGSFMSVITIALVGKIVISLFKNGY